LEVYFKLGKQKSSLYDDAHDGYDYTKGRYSLKQFKLTGKENELILQQHIDGTYQTPYNYFILKLIGLPFNISKIEIDNVEMEIENETREGVTTILVDKNFSELHIME
ncbi:MAG: DUF5110 domain-containing protein, partial [Marinirhabdus sp.]